MYNVDSLRLRAVAVMNLCVAHLPKLHLFDLILF